jgi:hypothetical protein
LLKIVGLHTRREQLFILKFTTMPSVVARIGLTFYASLSSPRLI